MIDVILPCWTKKIPDQMYKCIYFLTKNTQEYNLIIVGSEDTQPKNINKGLERAKSKYVAILDWDVYVPEGWDKELTKHLDDNPSLGLVGPAMGGNYGIGANTPRENEVTVQNMVVGGCMVFRNIGLKWDEAYPAGYYCDDDFCRQFMEKGYKIALISSVVVNHDILTTTEPSMFASEMTSVGQQIFNNKWGIECPVK